MKATKISWTDSTFNLVWGCSKVSPGCYNCYADSLAARYGWDIWGRNKTRRVFGEKHWMEPLKWNAEAEKNRQRHRVFCSSMCDVFEDHATVEKEREKLWPLIRLTPWLDWQLLTKRPERIAGCLPPDWGAGYPNVWMGTSVENQEWAEKRMPHLLAVNARVRFLSVEPMLGPIDFEDVPVGMMGPLRAVEPRIHWVIFGGESGSGFRACDPQWIASGADQCRAAGVAVWVKQDSGSKPGQQGRLPAELFNTKEMPKQ